MKRHRRRAVLASLGAVAGSVAGCLGPTSRGSTAGTDSSASTPRSTSGTTRIRTEVVERVPTEATVTVFPTVLREWLQQAAAQTAPVRGHDETYLEAPEPYLERVDTVELTAAGDRDGVYDLSVDGGPRYTLHVGATPVDDVPTDATVTELSTLSDARRELVETAIEEMHASVFPETALGEWARTEFFGDYVSHDGTTYRGHEVQQTDAAFFSTEVWYVLSLSSGESEETSALTLDLSPVPDDLPSRLEPLLSERKRSVLSDPVSLSSESRAFVEDTAYLLTHTRLVELSLVG